MGNFISVRSIRRRTRRCGRSQNTPGGLGIRDKVIEVLLNSFGVDPSVASLTPILYSIALMSSAVIGIGFFLLDMKGSRAPEEKKS